MPGCIVSATTASFRSVEKRRRRATPVMTSTFENVADIGVCLGLYLGPPAKAGVRSKQGAVHTINQVKGTIVCNPGPTQVVVDTPFVPLSAQGDAEFDGNIGHLPAG